MNEMKNFNLQCFLDCANELLRADETARALSLLDNLPAWYRVNTPKEVTALKREIMKNIATAGFYATSSGYELTAPDESYTQTHNTLRGRLLINDVLELNKIDLLPHILDLGPGEYWAPRMLQHQKCLFSYEPVFVNHPSHNHYKKHFEEILDSSPKERPKILFAGEIIEHLWNENEIRFEMERHVGLADIVHISTPAYTFDYECLDWRTKGDLGHLRAYAPQEFHDVVVKMFPDYDMTVIVGRIMHARGVLKDTQFESIKNYKLVI